MATVINVNGRIAHGTDATIPVLDHGFLYGEGVYEVCRTYHGHPLLFDRHMRRMRNSADMIALPVPFTDDEALALVDETLAAGRAGDARAFPGPRRTCACCSRAASASSVTIPPPARAPSVVVIVKPHVGACGRHLRRTASASRSSPSSATIRCR